MNNNPTVVGIGEILWDVYPEYKTLGGAPANVIYHCSQLGMHTELISRVGSDDLGTEALKLLKESGVQTNSIQVDEEHNTGTVAIRSESSEANYTFAEHSAWDFIEASDEVLHIIESADFIVYGTLAQRTEVGRKAIQSMLSHASQSTLICDINLREPHVNIKALEQSLHHADVLKINESEAKMLQEMFHITDSSTHQELARAILKKYDCKLVCITLGSEGSMLVTLDETHEYKSSSTDCIDTVGAGDAFTAAMCYHLWHGSDLQTMNKSASSLAAWVCTQSGAMPAYDNTIVESVRA